MNTSSSRCIYQTLKVRQDGTFCQLFRTIDRKFRFLVKSGSKKNYFFSTTGIRRNDF
jgi:hypothetical protein